jgi:hypothetical protein
MIVNKIKISDHAQEIASNIETLRELFIIASGYIDDPMFVMLDPKKDELAVNLDKFALKLQKQAVELQTNYDYLEAE